MPLPDNTIHTPVSGGLGDKSSNVPYPFRSPRACRKAAPVF